MTELFPYQKKGVRKISHFKGRSLLADEMGLGKTLQALYWAAEADERLPVIVVCPAHLKHVWSREASHHLGLMAQVLEGRKPDEDDLKLSPRLIIINYDILAAWESYLKKINAKTLIVDECHFIKNQKAKRTKATKRLSVGIPFVVAISGTPLTNRPAELFPALNILHPEQYKSFWSFAKQYCQLRKDRFGWRFDGAKNLPELHKRLSQTMMIRRRKADVLMDLPDKRREVVPLEIENKAEYERAKNRFIEWLAAQSFEKADAAQKAEQLTKIGYLKRLAAELKMEAAQEWINDFLEESESKLVVFGVHHSVLDSLHDRYKKISVLLTGKTPVNKKGKAVDAFQHNPAVRLFFGNIQAAGTGITLTSSSDLVFVEMGWTPGEHLQAEDRIHRIGQKAGVLIRYLVAADTIEEDLCSLVQKKFSVTNQVLDGGEGEDFDIIGELLKKQNGQTNHPVPTGNI